MKNELRAANETAITLEQHRALTDGRTRPLTDRAMSNAKAARWRAEQTVVSTFPMDNVVELVQRIVDARAQHTEQTEERPPAKIVQSAGGVHCGTNSGYVTHRRHGETACDLCKAARRRYKATQASKRRAS